MAAEITDDSFELDVIKSGVPVLVDFWATWCGPCKMLAPVLDELSTEMADRVKIVKMDIDNNPKVPSALGIRGVPTMILFKNGEPAGTKVGALPKASITQWLESIV